MLLTQPRNDELSGEPTEVKPPVAARETARALARVRRSAARRRITLVAGMMVFVALLSGGGLAFHLQNRRASLDPCPGEWPVWGPCMRSTELFDREQPFLRFCGKNRALMRVCIRKRTCEAFRACARSTVERWRHHLVLGADSGS
jgi:hypothetical protein